MHQEPSNIYFIYRESNEDPLRGFRRTRRLIVKVQYEIKVPVCASRGEVAKVDRLREDGQELR